MANSFGDVPLTNRILLLRDDAFYDLVRDHCGEIVLEVIKAQDISSVDCFLAIDNVFTFLELDSDELIPLRQRAGITLNNGRFVIKRGSEYKVELFLKFLRSLHQQHITSSHHQPRSSLELTVPNLLAQKFPFIRTMIEYASLLVDATTDLTFFNDVMDNIVANFALDERGYRYKSAVRQFAFGLYILGGRSAYEFVRMNIPAFLPSVCSLQMSLASTESRLFEGVFRYDGLQECFTSNQSTFGFCAEDCTAIIPNVNYDTTSNTFIGFALPLDNNGFPITDSYSTDSLAQLESWCSDVNKAKQLNIHVVQSLSPSLHHPPSYLLAAYGTDNRYTSKDVLRRWSSIFQQSKDRGIRILGFSTDCDARYLKVMRLSLGFFAKYNFHDHPDLFQVNIPSTWSWFLMNNRQLFVCLQDPIHLCTKLRNRLLSTSNKLLLGDELVNVDTLLELVEKSSKLNHGLVKSDIDQKDRQNYGSCVKISSDDVLTELEKLHDSAGIRIYLQVRRLGKIKFNQ